MRQFAPIRVWKLAWKEPLPWSRYTRASSAKSSSFGDDHAALAAGHDLRRVEGEGCRRAERSGRPAAVRAAVRVSGVLDEVHAGRRAHARELVDRGGHQAADVDDDHGRGLGAEARREIDRVDRHGLRVAVDEAQTGAGVHGGGRRREERVGRYDDLASGDADRPEDDLERGRSRVDRHRVTGAVPRRERLFELRRRSGRA